MLEGFWLAYQMAIYLFTGKNKHSLWLTPQPENIVQYIFAGDMSPPLFETTSFIPNIF